MEIKSSSKRFLGRTPLEHAASQLARFLLRGRRRYLFYAVGLIAFALVCIGFGTELHRTQSDWILRQTLADTLRSNVRVPVQFLKGLVANAPVLAISIQHLDYMKLAHQRALAWEAGRIAEDFKQEYVPANISVDGQTYRAKVRLKGLWLDHLQQDKWSMRIALKGGEAVFGMKRFSIHAPYTRNYIHEWLYHRGLAQAGLIALRYLFVAVQLNGKDQGIFALEEHFETVLPVRNNRPEGILFKPYSQDVHIYREARLLAVGPVMVEQIQTLRRLYTELLTGRLEAHQVFDPDAWARYFAVSDLFAAHHSHIPGNLVCYFNPVTHRIEPVGYDAQPGGFHRTRGRLALVEQDGRNILLPPALAPRLRSDPVIMKRYTQELAALSEAWIEQLLTDNREELQQNLAILYKSYPGYHFDTRYLYQNLASIRAALDAEDRVHEASYRLEGPSALVVSARTSKGLPVEIVGVARGEEMLAHPVDGGVLSALEGRSSIRLKLEVPRAHRFREDTGPRELVYRLLGGQAEWRVPVYPAPLDDRLFALHTQARARELDTFDFLDVDREDHQVSIRPGRHTVQRDLIVPRGYRLEGEPGTVLDLAQSAKIVSFGPVRLLGSEEMPFVITSSDRTGEGLIVLEANGDSLLRHVVVEKQTSAAIGAWRPRGAMVFYESPITLEDSVVRNTRAEDGLNIIRSSFTIRNSVFEDCHGDALDVDFGTGVIEDTAFLHSGNDGIDLSGSSVAIRRVLIDHAGDKGVSAGERSDVHINGLDVRSAYIGVTSKDLSTVVLKDVKLADCEYGLAAYRKKLDFGPGTLVAERPILERVHWDYAVEPGSSLTIDSKTVAPNIENAKDLFYGAP